VVEVSICNFLRSGKHLDAAVESALTDAEKLAIGGNFKIGTVYSCFMFVAFFSAICPAGIYLYSRMGLLSANVKFLRLYAIFGYSAISYLPAILLTLINNSMLSWIFIALAFTNQILALRKNAEPIVVDTLAELPAHMILDPEKHKKVLMGLRLFTLAVQGLFAFVLRIGFV
jgi:hypothetical protein